MSGLPLEEEPQGIQLPRSRHHKRLFRPFYIFFIVYDVVAFGLRTF